MAKIYTDEDGNKFQFNQTTGNYEAVTQDEAAAKVTDGASEVDLPEGVNAKPLAEVEEPEATTEAEETVEASPEVESVQRGSESSDAPEVATADPKAELRTALARVLELLEAL